MSPPKHILDLHSRHRWQTWRKAGGGLDIENIPEVTRPAYRSAIGLIPSLMIHTTTYIRLAHFRYYSARLGAVIMDGVIL